MRRLDPVTLSLILLCLAATLQVEVLGRSYADSGALRQELVWSGQYWRFLSTIFVHGGWVHLLLNCLALYFIAPFLAQVCGRGVLFLAVVLSALAGLAASMIVWPAPWWRLGISGGVLGLLGLILAIEWAASRRVSSFLRRRNVIVVAFFLALNVALALFVEARRPDIRIDHAAHAGGLVFALAAGLALYGPRGRRPGRAAAVSLLLLLPALAYAAHPFLHADFYRYRAQEAHAAGDLEREAEALENLLLLDVGSPFAGARLALLRDDPAVLDGLREPVSNAEELELLTAHLELARRRLESDGARALALVERALGFRTGSWKSWLALGRAADAAGRTEIAARALERAALEIRESAAWQVAQEALESSGRGLERRGLAPRERLERSTVALRIALRAAGGLREGAVGDHLAREELESGIDLLAHRVAASARLVADAEPGTPGLRELYGDLARLWQRLADNAGSEQRAGRYLFWSAHWWWRELEGSRRDFVLNRFRAALESGDPRTERLVRTWLREHGQVLPESDLAQPQDGG